MFLLFYMAMLTTLVNGNNNPNKLVPKAPMPQIPFVIKDDNCLWGCAGLHGGLVGIWFLLNNGLVEISNEAPIWLVGPGNIPTNPLGGLYGISLLITSCIFYYLKLRNQIFKIIK